MLLFVALACAAVAAPPATVDGQKGCVDAAALGRELDSVLPDSIDPTRIHVAVSTARNEAGRWDVLLGLVSGADSLLERRLQLSSADCPAAAALLARIVARRLEALPRHAWARRVDRPGPVAAQSRSVRLRADFGVRLGVGLPDSEVRGGLSAGLRVGLWRRLWLDVHLGALLSEPVRVGAGHASIVSAGGAAGLSWRFALGRFGLSPGLQLGSGLTLSRGRGFSRGDSQAVEPVLDAIVGLRLDTPARIGVQIGVAMPLVTLELVDTASSDVYREPPMRLWLAISWTFAARGRRCGTPFGRASGLPLASLPGSPPVILTTSP